MNKPLRPRDVGRAQVSRVSDSLLSDGASITLSRHSQRAVLSKKKKEYFRKVLVGRLNALVAESDSAFSDVTGLGHESSDPLDQASLEVDRGLAFRMKQRERKLIGQIEQAMRRLEEGTFGLCEDCGEEISEKRLKAFLMTTTCIQCKREQETRERVRGVY